MKDSIIQEASKNKLRKLLMIVIWVILWHVLSLWIHNEIFLPGPWKVAEALIHMLGTKSFWLAIFHSLWRISLGFISGFLLAIILGGFACKLRLLRDFLSPMISMMKTIPVASFIILILVWVNSKYLSIFISFLVTFPILYIAVLEGYDHVNRELLEMTQVYKVKAFVKLRYLYLSELLPFVVSSAKVAVGMCWKAGISGEIIGLPKYSIGEQLYLSKLYFNISDLFGWTLVIVLVCFIFEKTFFFLLHQVEKRLIS